MVVRSPPAEKDFFAAVTWLSERSLTSAKYFIDNVEQGFNQLELFPNSGAHIPEFPNLQAAHAVSALIDMLVHCRNQNCPST